MTDKHSRRAALGAGAGRSADTSVEKKIVTIEQMAARNFEPWKHEADEWEPPSNDEWEKDGPFLLPFARMAWMALFKTKAELEAIAEGLAGEPFEELVAGIVDARKYFENFVTILDAAEVRIMCAAASQEVRSGKASEA
jgi:hypothetical protein